MTWSWWLLVPACVFTFLIAVYVSAEISDRKARAARRERQARQALLLEQEEGYKRDLIAQADYARALGDLLWNEKEQT